MANISCKSGELITGDGTTQLVTFTDTDTKSDITFFLKVVSGTGVKVGIDSIATTAYAFTSSDSVLPVTCQNGRFAVKSTNGDTFVISKA